MTSGRAVDVVFGTPELLEQILLQATFHPGTVPHQRLLISSQRVNTTFRNTITKSLPLRRILFLETRLPCKVKEELCHCCPPLPPMYPKSNPVLKDSTSQFSNGPLIGRTTLLSNVKCSYYVTGNRGNTKKPYKTTINFDFASKDSARAVLSSDVLHHSWSAMYLTAPACPTSIDVEYPGVKRSLVEHKAMFGLFKWKEAKEEELIITATLKVPELTLGHITRLAAQMVIMDKDAVDPQKKETPQPLRPWPANNVSLRKKTAAAKSELEVEKDEPITVCEDDTALLTKVERHKYLRNAPERHQISRHTYFRSY